MRGKIELKVFGGEPDLWFAKLKVGVSESAAAQCHVVVVCSIASGLTLDAFRASFLQQCLEAGISDLMDTIVTNAHESHKRVRLLLSHMI